MENDREGQLAIIAQARAAAADRLVTPWWYHPVLGLLLAGYVLTLSLGSVVVKIAGGVLFLAVCLAVVAFAGTMVVGRRFDAALREHLRAGA